MEDEALKRVNPAWQEEENPQVGEARAVKTS